MLIYFNTILMNFDITLNNYFFNCYPYIIFKLLSTIHCFSRCSVVRMVVGDTAVLFRLAPMWYSICRRPSSKDAEQKGFSCLSLTVFYKLYRHCRQGLKPGLACGRGRISKFGKIYQNICGIYTKYLQFI